MKLVPLVEVLTTKPRLQAKHARPLDTPADKIAAAAHQGETHVQPMVMIKTEGFDHTGCSTCETPPAQYFAPFQAEWAITLAAHDVEWDPDIRL